MAFTNRPAGRGDWARLLPLVEAYYKFDSIAFDRIVTGRAVRRFAVRPFTRPRRDNRSRTRRVAAGYEERSHSTERSDFSNQIGQ